MNEEQYQYVYRAYQQNPFAFNNDQVDQLANAAGRLNLEFKRDGIHEEATIGSVLGNMFSGVITGFTTINIGEAPENPVNQIANNIGYLLGFVGFVPGIGSAATFATRTIAKNVIPKAAAKTIGSKVKREATLRTAAATRSLSNKRVQSIPFMVANKIVGGIGESAAARKATDFFIKKGMDTQVVSKMGDVAKEGLRLGFATSVSSWQGGIDQMASSFVHGATTGAAFRGFANFTNFGSEAANKFARVFADTAYSGGMSTLAGDPMPVQVYNYALGALFGHMETPLKYQQASQFMQRNVSIHKQRDQRVRAIRNLRKTDDYKNQPQEVKDIIDHDIDIVYGREARVANEIFGENDIIMGEALLRYAADNNIKRKDVPTWLASLRASREYVNKTEDELRKGATEEEARIEAEAAEEAAFKEAEETISQVMFSGEPHPAQSWNPRDAAERESYKPAIGGWDSALERLAQRSSDYNNFMERAPMELSRILGSVNGDRPEDVELVRNRLNELDPAMRLTEKDDGFVRRTMNTFQKAKEQPVAYVNNGVLKFGKRTDNLKSIRNVGDSSHFDKVIVNGTDVRGVGAITIKAINAPGLADTDAAPASTIRHTRNSGVPAAHRPLRGMVETVRALSSGPSPLLRFYLAPQKSKGYVTAVSNLLQGSDTPAGRRVIVADLNRRIDNMDKEHGDVRASYNAGKREFIAAYRGATRGWDGRIGGLDAGTYYDLNAANTIKVIESSNAAREGDGPYTTIALETMMREPDKFIADANGYVKRMQLLTDSNFSTNTPYIERIVDKNGVSLVENGGYNYRILNDINRDGTAHHGGFSAYGEKAGEIQRLDDTDGVLLMRPDVFDAHVASSGLEGGIGSIKSTVVYSNEARDGSPLGLTAQKYSAIRLNEKEAAFMYEGDQPLHYMVMGSSVKQLGYREATDYRVDKDGNTTFSRNEVYKAPIESFRINNGPTEHHSSNQGRVRVPSQLVDDINDPAVARSFYESVFKRSVEGDAASTDRFRANDLENLNIDDVSVSDIVNAVDPITSGHNRERRGWAIKQIVLKNLPDADNDYSIRSREETARATKILQAIRDTDAIERGYHDLDPAVSTFVKDRVNNYVKTRLQKPMHDVGGQSIFTSSGDGWFQKHLTDFGNSDAAKNLPADVRMSLRRGIMPEGYVLFNNRARRTKIKWLDGKKVSLEEAVSQYQKERNGTAKKKQMEDLLTFIFARVPLDSAPGVVPAKVIGFGARDGHGTMFHGEDLKRMGGADIDIDKSFWFQDLDGNGTGTGPIMQYFNSRREAQARSPQFGFPQQTRGQKIASLFSPTRLHQAGADSKTSNDKIGVYANISRYSRNVLNGLRGEEVRWEQFDDDGVLTNEGTFRVSDDLDPLSQFITWGINSSADGYNTERSIDSYERAAALAGAPSGVGIYDIVPVRRARDLERVFNDTETSLGERLSSIDLDGMNLDIHPRHRAIGDVVESFRTRLNEAEDPAFVISSASTSSVNRVVDMWRKTLASDDPEAQLSRFLSEGFGSPSRTDGRSTQESAARNISAIGHMVALDRRGRAAIAEMEQVGFSREEALVNIEYIQTLFREKTPDGSPGLIHDLARVGTSNKSTDDVFKRFSEEAEVIQNSFGTSARLYFEMIARGGRRFSDTPTEAALNMLRNVRGSQVRAELTAESRKQQQKQGISKEEANAFALNKLRGAAERRAKNKVARQNQGPSDWLGMSAETHRDYANALVYVSNGLDTQRVRAEEPQFSETGRVDMTPKDGTPVSREDAERLELSPDPVSPRDAEEAREFSDYDNGLFDRKILEAADKTGLFNNKTELGRDAEQKVERIRQIFHEHPDLLLEMTRGGAGVVRDYTGTPIDPRLWKIKDIDDFIDFFDKTKSDFLWRLFTNKEGELPRLAYALFPDRVIQHIRPFDASLSLRMNQKIITGQGIKDVGIREFFSSHDRQRVVARWAHEGQARLKEREVEQFARHLDFLKQEQFKEDAQDLFIVATALRELGILAKGGLGERGEILKGFKAGYKDTEIWSRWESARPLYDALKNKVFVAAVPKIGADGRFVWSKDGKKIETGSPRRVTGKDLFGTTENPNSGILNKGITNILRDADQNIIRNRKGERKHLRWLDEEKGILDLDKTAEHLFEMIRRDNKFEPLGIEGVNRLLHGQQIEKIAIEMAGGKRNAKFRRIREDLHERNPFSTERPEDFDGGLTAFMEAQGIRTPGISMRQIGQIDQFAYFPHNGTSRKDAADFIKLLESKLQNVTSETERKALQIRIAQLYSSNAAPEAAFSQYVKDVSFSRPISGKGPRRDVTIVRPRPTQSRGSEPMPGWDPSDRAIRTYIEQITQGYYNGVTAFISNHEMARFEERHQGWEFAKDWAEWGRTYLRQILGHDTMYSDMYLKRENTVLDKSPAYYTSDRYAFEKWKETYLKNFNKEKYREIDAIIKQGDAAGVDWTRDPRIQRFASQVRQVSIAEGKFNMLTLLANSRASSNNLVGGNMMTMVSTGFAPWVKAWRMDFWRGVNPEWRSRKNVVDFAVKSGAIESYIIDEVNLNPDKFRTREAKLFINELVSKVRSKSKRGELVTENELKAIARRNNVSEGAMQAAAAFMRIPEQHLRAHSFLTHYIKARDILGSNGSNMAFDDPMLINFALKGVKATQFLYNAAERPIATASSIGKIMSRFQLWSWNSIRFRRDVYRSAREAGYEIGTPEFDRYKLTVQADLFVLGLASAIPLSMFEAVTPAPFNYIEDLADYFFGDEDTKERAFFGVLPYPLNVVGLATPPSSRIFTALTSLASGETERFLDYQMYTMVPFGMMFRNTKRTLQNPGYLVDNMTGMPLHRISRELRERREQDTRNPISSPFSLFPEPPEEEG